jgi:antitoxin component of RelBE/YafQ-DinJ toxin-antitoxin module
MFAAQAVRERQIPFRVTTNRANEMAFASEKTLAKDWLTPEEDEVWRDL